MVEEIVVGIVDSPDGRAALRVACQLARVTSTHG